MKRMTAGVVLAAVILGLTSDSHAASFTNELPAQVGVWDISGEYTEDLEGESISYTLSQDGKGRLSGYGYAVVYESGYTIEMDINVSGSLKSKREVYYIKQKLAFNGMVYDEYDSMKFKGSILINAQIDAEQKEMYGSVAISLFGEKVTESFYSPIDDLAMDGSVVIYTDVDEVNGKLLGATEILLSNGRTVYCEGRVKEGKKDGSLTLKAKGIKQDSDSRGSSLQLQLSPSGELMGLKGKVCGQSIQWVAEDA